MTRHSPRIALERLAVPLLLVSPVAFLLFFWAPSSDGPELETSADSRSFVRLELEAAPGSDHRDKIESLATLVPGSTGKWQARKGSGPLEGDQGVLHVSPGTKAVVRISGDVDQSPINRVIMKVTVHETVRFRLQARGKMRDMVFGESQTLEASAEPQLLLFEVDAIYDPAQAERSAFDVSLLVLKSEKGVLLHSAELLFVPPAAVLPTVKTGPGLILAGDEFRDGVLLAPKSVLSARVSVVQPSTLRFAISSLPTYRLDEAPPTIDLTLSDSRATSQTHSYTLSIEEQAGWQTIELPLDDYRGEELELSWNLGPGVRSSCALAEVGLLSGKDEPARVLLITSDTHRADHLGHAFSGVEVRTPALDELARQGLSFSDCFSSTNVTNPSHVALMTGQHPRDVGVLNNNIPVNQDATTLAEAFRAAGFATYASLSAKHLGDPGSGLGQGFDRMAYPIQRKVSQSPEVVDQIIQWLDDSADVPTFLWLHLFDAHTPYDPPLDIERAYYPNRDSAYDKSLPALTGAEQVATSKFPGLRDLELPLALYRAEITSLDRELARLFAHPRLSVATIAFTADHGESLGNHSNYYNHSGLYPDSLHVPLILRSPELQTGLRYAQSVRMIDLGRTLLDLSGEAGQAFPGQNLVLQAESGDPQTRFAISARAKLASVTEDDWHLILWLEKPRSKDRSMPKDSTRRQKALDKRTVEDQAYHSVKLFHLGRDPHTASDLSDKEHRKASELRTKLIDWLRNVQDLNWRGEVLTDSATLGELEALGYVAGTKQSSGDLDYFPASCECESCLPYDG